MKKLNDKIRLAMARYFHNRNKQYVERRVDGAHCMTVKMLDEKAPKWDKDADRRAIDELARKAGFSYAAAPGTFWFRRGKRVIECNETNYLDGGVIKVSAAGSGEGAGG